MKTTKTTNQVLIRKVNIKGNSIIITLTQFDAVPFGKAWKAENDYG
jgi:hypothetical protein